MTNVVQVYFVLDNEKKYDGKDRNDECSNNYVAQIFIDQVNGKKCSSQTSK